MAKKRAEEPDEVKLKKKIGVKLTDQGNQEGGADLRSLKKRLKREQRKRRALVQRKKRAAGSKGAAATSA
ncbi:MAG: hypothetical protein E8D52_14335 [Nitrospira sp.]|jgi:hypothetical protein|nr:MAG: hypothetical protein E8D52_14335 [Nitrospira sp.]TKB78165.1 MAG: hypothetical protein E8D42_09610 [Nitrospira sp.]